MKIYILSICICFLQMQSLAQGSYHISYEFGRIVPVNDKLFEQPNTGYINLVFNDSVCYNYYSPRIPRLKNNQKLFGKRFGNHHYMFDVPHKMIFSTRGGRSIFATQLPDSMDLKPWIFNESAKESILEYECQAAYRVVGVNDTMKIKFAAAIPHSFGPQYPSFTPGLLGAILEYYNLGTLFYYRAVRVVKGNFELLKPEKYTLK